MPEATTDLYGACYALVVLQSNADGTACNLGAATGHDCMLLLGTTIFLLIGYGLAGNSVDRS